MANTHQAHAAQKPGMGSFSFRTIFAVGFLLFASIAVVAQMLGWNWRSWLPGAEGVKSMTGGVKAAVYTFMSHLQ
jgi:light-harvesting complex 1 beta chain